MTTMRMGSRPRRRSKARSSRISEVRRPGAAPLIIILLLAMGAIAVTGVVMMIASAMPHGADRETATEARIVDAAVRQCDLFHDAADLATRCPEVRTEAREAMADGSVEPAEVGRLQALAFVRCRID